MCSWNVALRAGSRNLYARQCLWILHILHPTPELCLLGSYLWLFRLQYSPELRLHCNLGLRVHCPPDLRLHNSQLFRRLFGLLCLHPVRLSD